jgi:uncharacterized glyoxalase superfamily protein PhnB
MSYAKDGKSAVIPGLRYKDAHKAMDWLVAAFGFKKQAVYEGPNGTVAHAQLTLGSGMVMVGSVGDTGPWAKWLSQPSQNSGKCTQSINLTVTDATAVYANAKEAGAKIVQELAEMPYGGKAFGCLDLEGHLWSIGEYDPWAEPVT